MMILEQYRKEIHHIDEQIIKLLIQRFAIVEQIAIYKHIHSLPIYDPIRRKNVLSSVLLIGRKKGLSSDFITDVWERIHQESLLLQHIKKSA